MAFIVFVPNQMPPSPFPSKDPTKALWGGILLPWDAPVKN